MKRVSICVLAAVAAVLWASAARAQREPGKPGGNGASNSPRPAGFAAASVASFKRLTPEQREEWRFLKEAAAASRFQAEASRLALAKSNNAEVRGLATTLIEHHASAGPALQHMLHVRSMAPPMLSNEQRKTLNHLTKIQGAKFDREYLDQVGRRTQIEAVQTYEKASLVAGDPVLKAWIDSSLPTLRDHATAAERLSAGGARLAKGQPIVSRPTESNNR
jgi:putative membrane protein